METNQARELIDLTKTERGYDLDILVREDDNPERIEYWPIGMFLKDGIDKQNAAHELRRMANLAYERGLREGLERAATEVCRDCKSGIALVGDMHLDTFNGNRWRCVAASIRQIK